MTSLADGRVLDLNDAMLKMLRADRKDAIGRTSVEIGIWRCAEERTKVLERLRVDRGGAHRFEQTVRPAGALSSRAVISGRYTRSGKSRRRDHRKPAAIRRA